MENECSNEQVKNAFDVLCMNHTIKTWPLLDDNSNKRTINVEFLKESNEENIDFEKETVIGVVNYNIQFRVSNRIKFLSQEEINNNVRSDIRISFSPEKPNSSEIGIDSSKVQGITMNLSNLREEDIIEQFMKALGYEQCTMIKYNLDLGLTPCEINDLLKESISYTEKRNTLSRKDVEWLKDTYNKETLTQVIENKIENKIKNKSIVSNTLFIVFLIILFIALVFLILLKYYK